MVFFFFTLLASSCCCSSSWPQYNCSILTDPRKCSTGISGFICLCDIIQRNRQFLSGWFYPVKMVSRLYRQYSASAPFPVSLGRLHARLAKGNLCGTESLPFHPTCFGCCINTKRYQDNVGSPSPLPAASLSPMDKQTNPEHSFGKLISPIGPKVVEQLQTSVGPFTMLMN